jgi:hypothetical protein
VIHYYGYYRQHWQLAYSMVVLYFVACLVAAYRGLKDWMVFQGDPE